jgi:hypothetical protein
VVTFRCRGGVCHGLQQTGILRVITAGSVLD